MEPVLQLKALRPVFCFVVLSCAITTQGLVHKQGQPWENPEIKKLSLQMDTEPNDAAKQIKGCNALQEFTQTPGFTAEQAWNQMAKSAMENLLQEDVAVTCTKAFGNVNLNRPLTLSLHKTSAIQALVAVLNQYPYNQHVQEQLLPVLAKSSSIVAPETTNNVFAIGGYKSIIRALQIFQGNPQVMKAAWRALGPHSQNPVGAYILANWGGPQAGIYKMLNELKKYPEPRYGEDPNDGSTMKFEILNNINGILKYDYNNMYGAAAMKHHLPSQIVKAMEAENDVPTTQDICCATMAQLTFHNVTSAEDMIEAGAIRPVLAAIKAYQETQQFGPFGRLIYPVVTKCTAVLMNMARSSAESRRKMVKAGVPDVLKTVRVELQETVRPVLYMLMPSMVDQDLSPYQPWWTYQPEEKESEGKEPEETEPDKTQELESKPHSQEGPEETDAGEEDNTEPLSVGKKGITAGKKVSKTFPKIAKT